METKLFQLADGAKRVDAKRRELMRHSEHQAVRVQALEKELDRQLGISDDLRRQVRWVVFVGRVVLLPCVGGCFSCCVIHCRGQQG